VAAPTNDYVPGTGDSFSVVSYGSFSGGFSGFNFTNETPGLVWQPVYGSTALTLVTQAPITLSPSGTSVTVSLNGAPEKQAILMTTTNLDERVANWTPISTNTFGPTCYFGYTVDLINQHQFFIFKLQ